MSTAVKVQNQRICSVEKLCQTQGMTRDAYYKLRARIQRSDQVDVKILSLVLERRKQLPREGGKKLYRVILPKLRELGIQIGRDKLFSILRKHNQLVRPKKRYVRTSYHLFQQLEVSFHLCLLTHNVRLSKNLFILLITYIFILM